MTRRKSLRNRPAIAMAVSDEADVEAETAAAVDDAVGDADDDAESMLSFFDSSKRFISFNMCAEAQEWPGLPAHLGSKWNQVLNADGLSKTTLDKMAMAFLDTSEQLEKIPEGGAGFADHYLRTFILSAFLKEVPHLITTNFFVMGTKGFGKIATIFSVCNQLQEESDDNKLRWVREAVGKHKWKPVGFKSEKPSRNALVGECLSLGMRYCEALCHGDAAKMDELRPRLVSLLKKMAEQADKLKLPPQAWDYAKIEGWGYRKFGRGKGLAMSIDFLQRVQEDPENHILGLNRADFAVLKEAMREKAVGAWMRGDTQVALFYMTWMDEPLLAFLGRMFCVSLKSVNDVKTKAEEMMTGVPKETQDVFIEFARLGSRCLGSETLVPDLRLSGIEDPKDRELKQEQRDLEEVDAARNRRETQKECMDNFIESAANVLQFLLAPEQQQRHQATDTLQGLQEAEPPLQDETDRQAKGAAANAGQQPEDDHPEEDHPILDEHDPVVNLGVPKSDLRKLIVRHWRHVLVVALGMMFVLPCLPAFFEGIGGTPGNPPSIPELELTEVEEKPQTLESTKAPPGRNGEPVETEKGIIGEEPVVADPTLETADLKVGSAEIDSGLQASDGQKGDASNIVLLAAYIGKINEHFRAYLE